MNLNLFSELEKSFPLLDTSMINESSIPIGTVPVVAIIKSNEGMIH